MAGTMRCSIVLVMMPMICGTVRGSSGGNIVNATSATTIA